MGLRREHPGGAGGVVCLKVHRLCLLCVVHEVNKPLSIARRVRSISRDQIEKVRGEPKLLKNSACFVVLLTKKASKATIPTHP